MKSNSVHILNGDFLLQQFPDSIIGERIVARECLVDGDVSGDSLDELFENRSRFLSTAYSIHEEDVNYFEKTVPEFAKILLIEQDSEVYLWFEDDLFCQVNLWFICSLLKSKSESLNISLVRPKTQTQYGFGGIPPTELPHLLEDKIDLTSIEIEHLADLWSHYRANKLEALLNTAEALDSNLPFVYTAVLAQIDRVTNKKPEQIVREILNENNSANFGEVFQKFNTRAHIYGFGNLQVKRIYDLVKQ